jgi:hypothetical protein
MNADEDIEDGKDEFGYSTEPYDYGYEWGQWKQYITIPDARGRLLEKRGVEVLESGVTR